MATEADSEWIEWTGGECPVDPDTLVQVRFGGFAEPVENFKRHPQILNWVNIIAYRVVSA